ncbi:MAG: hypothetical protein ABS921_11625 [Psychrobacter alimentarius]
MAHIIENGEVAEWFKDLHRNDDRSPREIIDDEIESGLMELYEHRCQECGRTWADYDDDYIVQCYPNEGCNSH